RTPPITPLIGLGACDIAPPTIDQRVERLQLCAASFRCCKLRRCVHPTFPAITALINAISSFLASAAGMFDFVKAETRVSRFDRRFFLKACRDVLAPAVAVDSNRNW